MISVTLKKVSFRILMGALFIFFITVFYHVNSGELSSTQDATIILSDSDENTPITMKGNIIFDLEGTLVDSGGTAVSIVFIQEETLKKLSKEYTLGIVTNATRSQLEYVLDNTFLGVYFLRSNTVSRDEISSPKETGESFQYILNENIQIPSVILGDSDTDRFGSEAIGVPFVYVDTTRLLNNRDIMYTYIEEAISKLQ
jgi:phosphoglycolate phosphatase-like HAD superfamily hydrolase